METCEFSTMTHFLQPLADQLLWYTAYGIQGWWHTKMFLDVQIFFAD